MSDLSFATGAVVPEPLRGVVRNAAIVLAVFLFAIVGIAAISPISGAVVATGVVALKGQTSPLQDSDGGAVIELLVKDGDLVQTGDILLQLDPAVAAADLGVIDAQIIGARIRISRLEAERDGLDFPNPAAQELAGDKGTQALSDEAALFRALRDAQVATHSRLEEQRSQLNDQIKSLKSQADALTSQAKLLDEEIASLQGLYNKGLVPLTRLNETKRQRVSLSAQIADAQANLASAQSKLSEIDQQKSQAENQFMSERLNDLRETANTLAGFVQRRDAAANRLAGRTVRSPIDGIVSGLAIDGKGSAVLPGKTMMTIVPTANGLAIDGQISPQMRDQVNPGAPCSVRLLSLDSRTTKRMHCIVEVVGAAVENDPRTGAGYFKLRAVVEQSELAELGNVPLPPGAPAEVFVETESRSLLDYLLQPLTRQFDRALRER